MDDARAIIMGGLRAALGERPVAQEQVRARLATRQRGTIPARSQVARTAQVVLFEQRAVAAEATIARVRDDGEVPRAVASYLAQENLPAIIRVAPETRLQAIDWTEDSTLTTSFGASDGVDSVALVSAFSAIAETGTLMLHSGANNPTTLNFLPDTHIVLLDEDRIKGAYEDAWDDLRKAGEMPRTVNFVTGPSRTADIEQTILMGAHGPRRLHIIIRENGS